MIRTAKTRIWGGLALGLLLLTAAGYGGYRVASVTGRVSASMAATQSSVLDLGTASYAPTQTFNSTLANGTGTGQFQYVFADSGTIAASDSVLIDLAGGSTDGFGQTLTCATLKGLMVTAKAANTNDVLVGGAKVAAIQFLGAVLADTTHVVPVGPGGVFLWERPATGVTVTGGSRDIIRLKNSGAGTGVGYSIMALCR